MHTPENAIFEAGFGLIDRPEIVAPMWSRPALKTKRPRGCALPLSFALACAKFGAEH
jgi:hypothetical protein